MHPFKGSLSFFFAAVFALNGCTSSSSRSQPDTGAGPTPSAMHGGTSAEPAKPTPSDPREEKLSAAIVALLERQHLRHRPIDDKISEGAFKRYLKTLDGGKMFLLKSDVHALSSYADLIDDQLHAGKLELAHVAAKMLKARIAVVAPMVASILAAPLDLTNQETVQTDPEKTVYANDDAELRDRWRKELELQVLERVGQWEERLKQKDEAASGKKSGQKTAQPAVGPNAPDPEAAKQAELTAAQLDKIPKTPEEREVKAREEIAKRFAGRFARLAVRGPLDDVADLVNAVTGEFDPHTNYMPPSDKANFDIQITGSLQGIGAVLGEDDHYIKVQSIVPGGACWRQGQLEAGDLIHAVGQAGQEPVDVFDMRVDDVVQMIRGPKGTVVTLTVEKSTGDLQTVSITRDVVVIEESYAKGAILKAKNGKGPSYGYIYLPSFYGGADSKRRAAEDVRRLLTAFSERKTTGVLLDMRENGGGLLDDARQIAGLFFERGPVVQTQEGDGTTEVLTDDDPAVVSNQPVVVLVDRFSASASEIVAGALQDYRRAIVVGTTTHGKGTVQMLADLDRIVDPGDASLGVLKLTVQQFFRVNGASTQSKGVVPDITFPDPLDYVESRESHMENSLPFSAIAPAQYSERTPAFPVPTLLAQSQKRVSQSTAFSMASARSNLFAARSKVTELPLSKSDWQAERDKQRAALEPLLPKGKEPIRLSVTTLNYDGSVPVAARPNGKTDDRAKNWEDGIARDPWVEEALNILKDLQAVQGKLPAGSKAEVVAPSNALGLWQPSQAAPSSK